MTETLERLFHPTSLAIVGASRDDQKGGGYLLKGLIKDGFKGKLYPINPRESEIMGLRCYPSILDTPGEIDVVIIAVPARLVPRLMAECGQKRVRFAVVHSVGFTELGAAGRELENEMLQVARQYGTRVVGPNCMGLYNPSLGLNTIAPRANLGNEPGPVAFVSQSGWVAENFMQFGYERGLRFSQAASIGNQSDLTIEDYFQYFAEDDQTKVIAAYIEGIKRGREFLRLARLISRKKPIIVLKGGKTGLGVRAAASHTGSLAGNVAVFNAAARQSGIVSAENLEQMVDLAVGFTSPVLPGGNRLGVLVEAGGGAVASADISEELGLEMPALPLETRQLLAATLQDIVPASSGRQNPVDLVWVPDDISAKVYIQCSRLILKDVDALLVVSYTALDEPFAAELAGLRDEMKKPIMLVPGWPIAQRQGMSLLVRNGIPTFTIPERGLKVLSAMLRYSGYLAAHKD